MDPFIDLVQLLRPQAMIWGAIWARGHWRVSFRERHDLLFFRVDSGNCQFHWPGVEPLILAPNDVVLVRACASFSLASDPDAEPVDSWALRKREMQVGDGDGEPVVVRGGRFVFETANEEILIGLLPPIVHIVSGQASSDRVRTLLAMTEAECFAPGSASQFVNARLTELLLVELLRSGVLATQSAQAGLLRGLADPVTAQALQSLHGNIAQQWTTAKLARLCGMSRSGFSLHFTTVVGIPPIRYLQRWRMAVAKDELLRGQRRVAEIALLVGYQSGDAFSTAFTRAVGCSPTRFAGYPPSPAPPAGSATSSRLY